MTSLEPKKIRKKTNPYTEDDLKKALSEIRDKKASVRQICTQYGIPKTTILDRIHGKTSDKLKKRGPAPVLGIDGEKKIADWVLKIAKCGFPIKKQELLDSVQKILNDTSQVTQLKDNRPGQTWYANFLKRHPEITSRSAESINKARAQVTEAAIRHWFDGLKTYLEEINQTDILNRPESIFNGDESGFALCPKTGKVLGPRGYRNLYDVKHGNEKDNLTVLITFNANGDLCPPCVVFPYIRPPRAVVESMPSDWCLGRSESGWMRGDVFFEYVTNDFNNWVERNNIQKPVLLLVDGHKSHMSLLLSTMCEELGVILYALPPNTTHILQPADVSVFAPLKANWKNTVRAFLARPENLNTSVTKTNFCKLFAETLQSTSLSTCIKNGFRRCGLYPFDPNAPDYSKCVLDTIRNIQPSQGESNKDVSRTDISITKKVLKRIKAELKDKNVNLRIIMKELNNLKKTIPVEINCSELTIDTESDCTNVDTSHPNVSYSVDTPANVQQPPPDFCSNEVNIIETSQNTCEDLNSISSLHLTGSYLDVGSVVSLDNLLILPLNVTEKDLTSSNANKSEDLIQMNIPKLLSSTPESSTLVALPEIHSQHNTAETSAKTSGPLNPVSLSETLVQANTTEFSASTFEAIRPLTKNVIPISSPKMQNVTDIGETLSRLTTGEVVNTLESSAIISQTNSQPNAAEIATPTSDLSNPPIASKIPDRLRADDNSRIVSEKIIQSYAEPSTSQSFPLHLSLTSTHVESSSSNDPFSRHLYLPTQPEKTAKTTKYKYKSPAAISSAAWREYYEVRERAKNLKQEETRKRKLERSEKQKMVQVLKESNRRQKLESKIQSRRRNSKDVDYRPQTRKARKENNRVPSAAVSKISCSECEADLMSDVEEDEDKNIGCDLCPRWYHLKCTLFVGQQYLDVKDKPFKCNQCD